MEGITKRFGSATALNRVDFAITAGEVHALVGENGAGKSTLIKIMTGAYHRDDGAMYLDGAAVQLPESGDAVAECQVDAMPCQMALYEAGELPVEGTRHPHRVRRVAHQRPRWPVMNPMASARARASSRK